MLAPSSWAPSPVFYFLPSVCRDDTHRIYQIRSVKQLIIKAYVIHWTNQQPLQLMLGLLRNDKRSISSLFQVLATLPAYPLGLCYTPSLPIYLSSFLLWSLWGFLTSVTRPPPGVLLINSFLEFITIPCPKSVCSKNLWDTRCQLFSPLKQRSIVYVSEILLT